MIVIDSSAVVAILLGEPESASFAMALRDNDGRVSALSVFESETVIMGRVGAEHIAKVRRLLESARVEIEPFDDGQARLANAAYLRFGKGRHPARLNMGDCAAYALAKSLNAPLLFKGDDFSQTDIEPVAHHR